MTIEDAAINRLGGWLGVQLDYANKRIAELEAENEKLRLQLKMREDGEQHLLGEVEARDAEIARLGGPVAVEDATWTPTKGDRVTHVVVNGELIELPGAQGKAGEPGDETEAEAA